MAPPRINPPPRGQDSGHGHALGSRKALARHHPLGDEYVTGVDGGGPVATRHRQVWRRWTRRRSPATDFFFSAAAGSVKSDRPPAAQPRLPLPDTPLVRTSKGRQWQPRTGFLTSRSSGAPSPLSLHAGSESPAAKNVPHRQRDTLKRSQVVPAPLSFRGSPQLVLVSTSRHNERRAAPRGSHDCGQEASPRNNRGRRRSRRPWGARVLIFVHTP